MDIRNSLDGLRSLLGVDAPAQTAPGSKSATLKVESALGGDRATLSSAAGEVLSSAGEADVRTDKVAQVQAAVAAGTYKVPASAVASKLVDAMLNGRK
jgi:negative regulator of flagellin synthesis FlgM